MAEIKTGGLVPQEQFSNLESPEFLEKRKHRLSDWVEKRVIDKNESEDIDLRGAFADLSVRERAETLYEKLMAYRVSERMIGDEKKENSDANPSPPDPYLISEIKELWGDRDTKEMFLVRFTEARADAKLFRTSELGQSWKDINAKIFETKDVYEAGVRQLFLGQLTRPDQVSAARGRTGRFAKELIRLNTNRESVIRLEGLPHTGENTDAAAHIMYDTIASYYEQGQRGFVWLPTREKIHEATIASLQNGRWPVLRGEAGTGKSEQADAAAVALTGEQPTHLACGPNTSALQLIAERNVDPETGGGYEEYGPAMQAFTGYTDSRQTEPPFKTGRIVRLDESGRMGDKGYSETKELRQKRPSTPDDRLRINRGKSIDAAKLLHGKPVLPGASAILTTNPEGARYPNRTEPDPALRRELAYISVDYPEMTIDNPELYEFMLSCLMDENKHISAAREELSPAYTTEHPADKKLADGRMILSEQKVVPDTTDPAHGALYRLSFAIREVQNAFNRGNMTDIPDDSLRYTLDNDGKAKVVAQGGDPLTLSTSTITLGEISSWITGFHTRRLKDEPEYHTGTLTEWIQLKLRGYVKQADEDDRDKIQAIFEHFHLFDSPPDIKDSKPMTPKEIGYLSPRVPRPVEVAPQNGVEAEQRRVKSIITSEPVQHRDIQCMLEDGSTILAKPETLEFEKDGKKKKIRSGRRFTMGDQKMRYIGFAPESGRAVVKIETGQIDEAIHRIIDTQHMTEEGEFKNIIEDLTEIFGDHFLGPEAVKKTFEYEVPETLIPDAIHDRFTGEELTYEDLERAKELGMFPILRMNRIPRGASPLLNLVPEDPVSGGVPLSMFFMNALLQPRFNTDGKGKILFNIDWYRNEDFYTKDTPELRWALVSKDVLPGSLSKNYLEQTQVIADYLIQHVFKGRSLPPQYLQAIEEFNREKLIIAPIITSNWQDAADRLARLKLNQLTRRTPAEALYDLLMTLDNTNERLLENKYDWTSSQTPDHYLVSAGSFDSDGLDASYWGPDISNPDLGVCPQR